MCNDKEETIFHILSNCSTLAANLYTARHDNALKCFIWPVLEMLELISTPEVNWFSHREVKPYYCKGGIHLWWDIPEYSIRKESTRHPLRPDAKIQIERGQEKKIFIVEMTVPWMSLREEKYGYKKGKYINILNSLKIQHPDYEIDQITLVMDVFGGYDNNLVSNIKKLIKSKEITDKVIYNMQKSITYSLANISRTFKVRSKLNII